MSRSKTSEWLAENPGKKREYQRAYREKKRAEKQRREENLFREGLKGLKPRLHNWYETNEDDDE